MTRGSNSTRSQSPPESPVTPDWIPGTPIKNASYQQLCDGVESSRSASLSLLKDTEWPPKSNDAVQQLVHAINGIPDIPENAAWVKYKVDQIIQSFGSVHITLKTAADKYGTGKKGIKEKIRDRIRSLRPDPPKCTSILQTCREDIENISIALRNVHLSDETRIDAPSMEEDNQGSKIASGTQHPSSTPLAKVESSSSHPESSSPSTGPPDPVGASEHLTSHRLQGLVGDTSNLSQDEENHNQGREWLLPAIRQVFQGGGTLLEALPVVGGFLGLACKLGSSLVDVIETMDENDDIAKELTSDAGRLSEYLERLQKKPESLQQNELTSQIEVLHEDIQAVQKKVIQWQSSGRLKKAFLACDFAEELKDQERKIQAVLEKTHLLLSFKIADAVGELSNTIRHAERRRLLDRLGDGGRGNSVDVATCHPGTRVTTLNRIDQWIEESKTSEPVLWVRGMAGCGKSTIAWTIAGNWKDKASCAIFHFRRGRDSTGGQFLCAIARQLGRSDCREISDAILDCVRENEDIANERLEQQFTTFFVRSMEKLQGGTWPILIILDGLDECEKLSDIIEFINLVDQHSTSLRPDLKFILTCRPEGRLLAALGARGWRMEDLDSSLDVSDDIRRFVQDAFKETGKDPDTLKDGPGEEEVERLVEMCQGSFQWAHSAISHIREGSHIHRLQEVLKLSSAWGGLDDLYHGILSRAYDEAGKNAMRRELLSRVLGTLVVAPESVSLEVMAFMHADHEMFKGQEDIVRFLRTDIIMGLNSLLHVPGSSSEPVRFMHTSIRDFLLSAGRCGHQPYFIDLFQEHRRLTELSLQILKHSLKQNICNLSDDASKNSGIQDIIKTRLSPGLRYCCRFWATHLTTGISWSDIKGPPRIDDQILSVFKLVSKEKLMCWLEVMSLIGATAEALLVAKQVHRWLLTRPREIMDDTLAALWKDVQRFIVTFLGMISSSPLQIYASALPRAPVRTRLWECYGPHQAKTQIPSNEVQPHWPANIWTSLAQSPVNAIAICPDGKILASGSDDKTVQFWDAQTGALRGDPLTGHKGSVSSVAFSPDGRVLASGSDDGVIKLWDVQTGAPLERGLAALSPSVSSINFSPDGKVLISTYADKKIKFWDTRTFSSVDDSPIDLNNWGGAVALSPDRKLVAFASGDNIVQLWDPQNSVLLGSPLTGHTDFITFIAFSPNSTVLATASADKTIRLWDAQTGSLVGHPLTGHKDWVELVTFSPDGKVLASAGTDQEMRLWDAQTGASLSDPLIGHTAWITSLAFSPDGEVLASASHDKTIRLWDAQTGPQEGVLCE